MSGLFGKKDLTQSDIGTLVQGGKITKITAAAAAGSFSVPAGYYIDQLVVKETANNAITGGLKFGTTAGGVDVAAALAVGALGLVKITNAALLKSIFSLVSAQTIYFDAVVAWNSAITDIYIVLKKLA